MHLLVKRNFDVIKMHGKTIKIVHCLVHDSPPLNTLVGVVKVCICNVGVWHPAVFYNMNQTYFFTQSTQLNW